MTTLFGIKNCDTVKKARKWLDTNQINYQFHDFRADGLTKNQVQQWLDEFGWESLVNKRSTSWKALDESTRNEVNEKTVVDLILETPTLIKRPLLDTGEQRHVGFKVNEYENLFK